MSLKLLHVSFASYFSKAGMKNKLYMVWFQFPAMDFGGLHSRPNLILTSLIYNIQKTPEFVKGFLQKNLVLWKGNLRSYFYFLAFEDI